MRKLILALGLWLCGLPCFAQVGIFIRPDSSSLSSPVQGSTWWLNSTNNTIQAYNGSNFFAVSAPKNNLTASTAPTTSNDNTQGYSAGSQWYNTNTTYYYSCVDATTSAAVWVQLNNLGALSIPLNNLATSGASTGQSLVFNGTHWAPGAPQILLSQILQSGATSGQVPVWNGSAWVPQSISGGGGGLPLGGTNNQILGYGSGAPGWFYGLNTANSVTVDVGATLTATSPSVIIVAPASTDQNVILPDSTTCMGKMFTFVQGGIISGYDTTVQAAGSDTIELFNGSAISPFGSTVTMGGAGHGNQYSAPITLISDGAGIWHQLTPIQQVDAPAGVTPTYFTSADETATLPNSQHLQAGNGVTLGVAGSNTYISAAPYWYPNNVSGTFNPTNTNTVNYVDLSAGNAVCTMPLASSLPEQAITVTVVAGDGTYNLSFAGDNINSAASSGFTTMMTIGASVTFVSDGTNWWTLSSTWNSAGLNHY